MCECFQIGGPFIAEDPECPQHGTEAKAERVRREQDESALHARLEDLENRVAALEAKAD